ncbi:thiopeptide-type bacteriocin biosynthesis protein [Azospirillum sp. ST 5-10]|uniref:thiopeptide-type bacteriocin biosynthesis protein n=1 Tax=unclassified Azospirillum TaxID=2630922 RepID=UPI003F49F01C
MTAFPPAPSTAAAADDGDDHDDHDGRWLSLHVFHGGDADRLLVEAVGPLLARLSASGAADGAFFVRYWNGGPHVRLRIRPAAGAERAAVERRARAALEAFLRRPAGAAAADADAYRAQAAAIAARAAAAGVEDEAAEPYVSAPCVQTRPYRWESEEYGGPATRALTHGLFETASRLALAAIPRWLEAPAARLDVAALLLAASLLGCAAPGIGSARMAARWAAEADRFLGPAPFAAMGLPPVGARRDPARDTLRQAAGLVRGAWAGSPWIAALRGAAARLTALHADGRLGATPEDVLLRHLHMLANRLGLSLGEELYLAALLSAAHEGVPAP